MNRYNQILKHLTPSTTTEEKVQHAEASLHVSDYLTNINNLLTSALKDSTLLPRFNISLPISSSRALKRNHGLTELCQIFTNAKLPPQMGFNPGSGQVSLTIKLPEPQSQTSIHFNKKQVLIWTALGLLPQVEHDLTSLPDHSLTSPMSFANQCLIHFEKLTGVAFISR